MNSKLENLNSKFGKIHIIDLNESNGLNESNELNYFGSWITICK